MEMMLLNIYVQLRACKLSRARKHRKVMCAHTNTRTHTYTRENMIDIPNKERQTLHIFRSLFHLELKHALALDQNKVSDRLQSMIDREEGTVFQQRQR